MRQYGWSKTELLRQIESSAHLNLSLDLPDEACYTEENTAIEEVPGHAGAKAHQCDGVRDSGTADGRKGFDTVITGLHMRTYTTLRSFEYAYSRSPDACDEDLAKLIW